MEFKIKSQVPLALTTPTPMKNLSTNLTKYIQNLFEEFYKNWWMQSKKNDIHGVIFHVPRYKASILSRWQFFLILSTDTVKSQWKFLQVTCGYWTTEYKVYMQKQKTLNIQHNTEEEKQSWRMGTIHLPSRLTLEVQ